MSKRSVALTALLIAAAGAALPTSASATYPGQNGAIAYAKAKYDKREKEFGYFGLGSLFTVLPDGSGIAALPDDATYDDYEPAWSPDGTQLAYVSVGAEKYTGIYIGSTGATKFKMLAKAASPDGPAWAPGGTSLAYVDDSKGIYTVDVAAEAKPRLLLRSTKTRWVSTPAYAADGSTLFYSSFTAPASTSTEPTSEIWAATPSGANPHKVLGDNRDLQSLGEPDVSPDSKQLVFASYKAQGKPGALWVSNVDGSGVRKLVAPPRGAFYTGPSWSPDGTKIVASLMYGSIKKGTALVLIDPTTGATTILRKARKTYMGTVSWQPITDATPAS